MSNHGAVTDDAFIDVVLPGTATASTATTVLHDFSTCTTKFTGLLQGGGMVFAVNTTTPTLTVSTANSVLGTSVREYVATQLYLAPKLHASNQLTQVSASDLEIVIEHGLNSTSAAAAAAGGGGKASNARYFLCAIVSADEAIPDLPASSHPSSSSSHPPPPPALIGSDPALLAMLRNIDTGSGGGASSQQLKANNAKRLPLDTPLSFPGIGTCMSYPDRKGNTVLLTSAPLLAGPALVARLYSLVSAAAPVFSNFDLVQAEDGGGAVALVTFRANAPAAPAFAAPNMEVEAALLPVDDIDAADDAATDVVGGEEEEADGGGGEEEGFATKSGKKKKLTPAPAKKQAVAAKKPPTLATSTAPTTARKEESLKAAAAPPPPSSVGGRLTAQQMLALVSLVFVAALFSLPVWLYGPQLYVFTVLQLSGTNPDTLSGSPVSVNNGIAITKVAISVGFVLAAVFIYLGQRGGGSMYAMALVGVVLALMLGTFTTSIFYDLSVRPNSIIRGLPGVVQSALNNPWRYRYDVA